MTPARCMVACFDEGYDFAGVQYYSECWCGNEVPPNNKIVDHSRCTFGCTGDRAQKCGGATALMNVYKSKEGVHYN